MLSRLTFACTLNFGCYFLTGLRNQTEVSGRWNEISQWPWSAKATSCITSKEAFQLFNAFQRNKSSMIQDLQLKKLCSLKYKICSCNCRQLASLESCVSLLELKIAIKTSSESILVTVIDCCSQLINGLHQTMFRTDAIINLWIRSVGSRKENENIWYNLNAYKNLWWLKAMFLSINERRIEE